MDVLIFFQRVFYFNSRVCLEYIGFVVLLIGICCFLADSVGKAVFVNLLIEGCIFLVDRYIVLSRYFVIQFLN